MWRFMTGDWLDGNAVTVDWFDASTRRWRSVRTRS